MYIDRIIEPETLVIKNNIFCLNNHLIGIKIIYEKENRPAFRLFVDSIIKKIVKSN